MFRIEIEIGAIAKCSKSLVIMKKIIFLIRILFDNNIDKMIFRFW